MTTTTDVTVVGAGPYGLAISAHLSRRGIEHRVLGRTMRAWSHHMPKGMFLKSEGFASNIADPAGTHTLQRWSAQHGQAYAAQGRPVPLDAFVAYGHWFQRQLVPHVEDVHVESLARTAGSYAVRLRTGETFTSRRVVLATGIGAFRHVPEALRGLADGLVSHPWDHADLSVLAGRDVTVVGAGQSALESAAILHELGADVRLLVRAPRVRYLEPPTPPPLLARVGRPLSGLGRGRRYWFFANLPGAFRHLPTDVRLRTVRTALGPAGAWWLRERVEGSVPTLTAHAIEAADEVDGRVRLRVRGPAGETVLYTHHVLAATGYRVDLDRLGLLDEALRRRVRTIDGAPALDGDLQASVPGLHVAGLAAAQTFGPVCRFVLGTTFTARRVARALAREPARAA